MGKKWLKRILSLLLVLMIALAGAVKLPYLWRELTFRWTEHTETELRVKAYADEMGVSYWDYPESLIDLLERNPETEKFVLEYPFRDEQELEIFEYDLSTGVPLMMQWDKRWGYLKYGSDMVGITGCGPVCLAMAGYYVTDGNENFHPEKIAEFAEKNGYYSKGNGSSWTLISEGGPQLGLEVTELPLVKQKIDKALEAGRPVILALGEGDFTSTGHYIVLAGVEDEVSRVNDPNSRVNSGRLWTYEELEGQIRNIWSIGFPQA